MSSVPGPDRRSRASRRLRRTTRWGGPVLLLALASAACPREDAPSADGPASAPASRPGPHAEGFARPEPRPVTYVPPPGVPICRYTLEETTTALLDGQPHAETQLRLDYVLERVAPGTIQVRVLRARARARQEDYEADLDSARPGDRRRVRGGADTLLAPRVAEGFALLEGLLRFELDGLEVTRIEGGDALRDAFLAMHPPAVRAEPAYVARARDRMADDRLVRWLDPLGAAPIGPEGETSREVELRQLGLRAEGIEKGRLRARGETSILEAKAAFTPSGPDADRPPLPGPRFERLAGTRERTVELRPGDPCFVRAAESWSTRVDRTDGAADAPRPYDRTRTRLWRRVDDAAGASP